MFITQVLGVKSSFQPNDFLYEIEIALDDRQKRKGFRRHKTRKRQLPANPVGISNS